MRRHRLGVEIEDNTFLSREPRFVSLISSSSLPLSFDLIMAMNAASNVLQSALGDKPTDVSSEFKTHPTETMLALQWHGKKDVRVSGRPVFPLTSRLTAGGHIRD